MILICISFCLVVILVCKKIHNTNSLFNKTSLEIDKLKTIISNINVSYLIVKDGIIEDVNNDFLLLTGYVKDELLGKNITNIIESSFKNKFKLYIKNNKTKYEISFITKNKIEKFFEVKTSYLSKDYIILSCWDISSWKINETKLRKKEEKTYSNNYILSRKNNTILDEKAQIEEDFEELKKSQNKIIELERMNSISAMGVTANHELNQPLTVIKMNIDILETDLQSQKYNLKRIHDIDKSLDKIIMILRKYQNSKDINITDYVEGIKMVQFGDRNE